jgi:hypothetical protein
MALLEPLANEQLANHFRELALNSGYIARGANTLKSRNREFSLSTSPSLIVIAGCNHPFGSHSSEFKWHGARSKIWRKGNQLLEYKAWLEDVEAWIQAPMTPKELDAAISALKARLVLSDIEEKRHISKSQQ